MSQRFDDYHKAYNEAVKLARACKCDAGIERSREYGRDGFTVKLLPSPERSFGHELRMERARPTDPFTDASYLDTTED